MGAMIWQLVCFLLGLLGYSIASFILIQPLHHIVKFVGDARTILRSCLFLLQEWLLLMILHSLESFRHSSYSIRATRTRHRPQLSTSLLLSLPAELRLQIWAMYLADYNSSLLPLPAAIRQRIWTMILADPKYVHVRVLARISYTSYMDQLRLYLGVNPEYSIICFSMEPTPRPLQMHTAFIQSCRQIYDEAGHGLYTDKLFYFTEAKALVSWIRSLTAARKRDVRDMRIKMPNDFFNHSCVTTSSLTRDAVQVRSAMKQLSGLRNLKIKFWTKHWFHTTMHEAQGIYQLVRSVKVSGVLIVQVTEEGYVRSRQARWTQDGWPADRQEDFAYAVWARIRHPGSELQQRVELEQGSRAKFVLRLRGY